LLLVFGPTLPWNSTNTRRAELVIKRIDDVGTAESLVSRLFPLGNECRVNEFLIDAVLIDVATDPFVCIV